MQKLIKALENEHDIILEKDDKIEILHNHSISAVVDIRITKQSTGEIYNIKSYNVLLGEFLWYDDNDFDACEDADEWSMDENCKGCPNYEECLEYEY